MGKAVPKSVKSKAEFLLKQFKEKLSIDNEKNKLFVNSLELPGLSKTTRNLMAGYITRKIKKEIEKQKR